MRRKKYHRLTEIIKLKNDIIITKLSKKNNSEPISFYAYGIRTVVKELGESKGG